MNKGRKPLTRKAYNTIKRGWQKGEWTCNIAKKAGCSTVMVYEIVKTRNYKDYLNGRREPNPSLWHRIFK